VISDFLSSDEVQTMNIRQAASASGLSSDTIRFYEKKGVLPSPPRQENGYRTYTEEHVETLRLARGLRDLGLPLDDVADILPVAHDGTCGDLRETLVTTLEGACEEVERRIVDLTRTRGELGSILDGVRAMPADARDVPGMTACGCVQLVAEGTGSAGS
jgi:DNA-binding transcriptional MerR regulator